MVRHQFGPISPAEADGWGRQPVGEILQPSESHEWYGSKVRGKFNRTIEVKFGRNCLFGKVESFRTLPTLPRWMLLGWERLGEVALLGLRRASQVEDALPCRVHHLRRIDGKSAASAGGVIDINHHLPGGFFDAHAAGRFAHRAARSTARPAQHCVNRLAIRRHRRLRKPADRMNEADAVA
jgi:hypothetical protein